MSVVEVAVGRPLRQAEQAIDVVRLDQALTLAKDLLDEAIEAEKLRATRHWIMLGGRPTLNVTPGMLEPLEQLHELGRQEAWAELDRLGYTFDRRFEEIEPVPRDRDPADYLRRNLTALEVRIEDGLVRADLGGLATDAIARALLRIPGGRDIASRIVSTALINGLAQTWEEVADEISCWEYTAILDRGTCTPCRILDGTRYRTLAELHAVLPNFGPNPRCLGGGRCRCRAVPCPPSGTPALVAPEPPRAFRENFASELGREMTGEVEPAWRALDTLLELPADRGPEEPLPVGQDHTLTYGIRGVFHHYANGDPVRISLNPARFGSATTLAHEVGHFLDYTYLGSSENVFATRIDSLLDAWREAVVESDARQQLLRIKNDDATSRSLHSHVSYLLEAKEVFARSFAQWVALRSGDPDLIRQIDDELGDAGAADEVYVPVQWQWDEFEPIAAAFDEIFATTGLLRERGGRP